MAEKDPRSPEPGSATPAGETGGPPDSAPSATHDAAAPQPAPAAQPQPATAAQHEPGQPATAAPQPMPAAQPDSRPTPREPPNVNPGPTLTFLPDPPPLVIPNDPPVDPVPRPPPSSSRLPPLPPISASGGRLPSLPPFPPSKSGTRLPSLGGARLPSLPSWPAMPLPEGEGPIARPDPIARAWFFLLFIGLGLVVVKVFYVFASALLMSVLFTSLMRPAMNTLERGMRPWVAASLICTGIIVAIVGPMVYLGMALSAEAAALFDVARMSVTMDKLNGYLFGTGWVAGHGRALAGAFGVQYTPETVNGFLLGSVATLARFLYDQVNAILSNFLIFIFHLLIFIVCLFYMLMDAPRLRAFLLQTSPLPNDEDEMIIEKFQSVGRAILWGNGVGSVVQGVLGGLALWAAGLPSPVLWSTVMAFAAFLPMIGISVVTVPATLYLALQERYLAATLFFAFTAVMSFVFEHIVKTKMIGSELRMHDAVILLSILAGLGVFGLMGILYGPLLVALFLVLLELYHLRYRPELLHGGD